MPPSPDKAKASRDVAKQATREALLMAGLEAFGEEGLDRPSLDAICARAGYTRGAFYVHFKDREDFLVAVMEHVVGSLIEALLGAAGSEMDLERSVRTFADAVAVGAFPAAGAVRSYHFFDACIRSPKLRDRFVQVVSAGMGRAAEAMAAGQDRGRLRKDVPAEPVALLLTALVIGAGTLSELGVPYDVHAAAEALIRMLRVQSG
jgi:TetR/AcrR family transcriptional regulator, transcriptional repressor for nem operon